MPGAGTGNAMFGAHHNPGSLTMRLQQQYSNLPFIPRAQGGDMSGEEPAVNTTNWNEYNSVVDQMNQAARNRMTGVGLRKAPWAVFMPLGTAPAPRGGGGGGGGGRSGGPRNKTTTLGPRTTDQYVAQHGGLSPQRGSALNAAYDTGNLTRPGIPGRMVAGADAAGAAGGAAGAAPAIGGVFDPLAAAGGGFGGGVGAGVAGMVQDAMPKAKMMAKGGPMKQGKPYLVGEEGPELILPRDNGDFHVLPADVTEQVLPMMMRDVTPKKRAEGGTMEMRQPLGDGEVVQRGFDMGPGRRGFATTWTGSGADTMVPSQAPMMLDPSGRYQLDMTQPGLPMLPDTVSGAWAEPGLPAPDMTAQNDIIFRRVAQLPGRGAVPINAAEQRVRDNAVMFNAELMKRRFDAEEGRVRNELAAREARAPLGTPTMQPGGVPPQVQQRMDRNMERFLSTPQGAIWAAEQQQQQAAQLQQQQAAGQWQTLTDASGQPFAMVNGRGQTISMPKLEQNEVIVNRDKQVPHPDGFGIMTVSEPGIYNKDTGIWRPMAVEGENAGAVEGTGSGGTAAGATNAPAAATKASNFLKRFNKPSM